MLQQGMPLGTTWGCRLWVSRRVRNNERCAGLVCPCAHHLDRVSIPYKYMCRSSCVRCAHACICRVILPSQPACTLPFSCAAPLPPRARTGPPAWRTTPRCPSSWTSTARGWPPAREPSSTPACQPGSACGYAETRKHSGPWGLLRPRWLCQVAMEAAGCGVRSSRERTAHA